MKIIKRIFCIFLLLITVNLKTVYAEPIYKEVEIKTTPIQITANVPEKFNKTIYVDFILEDGTNNNYVLTYQNHYKCDDIIKVGKAKLNFVNILNNNDEYNYYCDDFLIAEEGKNINFEININEFKSSNNESSKSDLSGNDLKEDLKPNENVEKDINQVEEIKTNNNIEKNTKLNSIKSLLLDGAIVILLIIIYLIIKNKKNKGEM